jgi:hypothetical protein
MSTRAFVAATLVSAMALVAVSQEKAKKPKVKLTREAKVQADQKRFRESDYWIYNDLPAGLARAKETGQPLLVVIRCIT